MKVTYRQLGPGMMQQLQSVCSDCSGEGEIFNESDKCKPCNGKKVIVETKIIEVHVDKGMRDGERITFRGEGDQQPNVEPGDVIIVLQQKPHEKFERHGSDLYMAHSLSLTEALCGFTIVQTHLDGRQLVIKGEPGEVIKPGSTKGIRGEGFPIHRNPFEKGNLYIKFDVTFPENQFASSAHLTALEKLLPPRGPEPVIDLTAEHVEEVSLIDYEPQRGGGHSNGGGAHGSEAYHSDDEEGGPRGPPGMPCANQ